MPEMSLEHVTNNYLDVLREIGNIGAGNAMTALSQMLQSKVDMQVPQVRLLEFSEVGAMVGGEEQLMVGVLLGVEGDITGSIMFLVELQAAKGLVKKMMMGYDSGQPGLDEMETSAMMELSNIITGAYLNNCHLIHTCSGSHRHLRHLHVIGDAAQKMPNQHALPRPIRAADPHMLSRSHPDLRNAQRKGALRDGARLHMKQMPSLDWFAILPECRVVALG